MALDQNTSIDLTPFLIGISAYLSGMDAICKRTELLPYENRISLSRAQERAEQLLDDLRANRTSDILYEDMADMCDTAANCALAHWGAGTRMNELFAEDDESLSEPKEPILAFSDSILFNIEQAKGIAGNRDTKFCRAIHIPRNVFGDTDHGVGIPRVWSAQLNEEFISAAERASTRLELEIQAARELIERRKTTVITMSQGPIEPTAFRIAVHTLANKQILPSESIRAQLADCANLNDDFHEKLAGYWEQEVGVSGKELMKAVDWISRAGRDKSFGETHAERTAVIHGIIESAWQQQVKSMDIPGQEAMGRLNRVMDARYELKENDRIMMEDPDEQISGPSMGS
ncbi:hypothetical protein EZI54_07480 [Marinobacter halodurans]|uniref:Uncharacterized protein n=1 Tax=Marinobacter halodurans TaxID=2528979 RepID=A0ABY1ZMK2_9GAMM|nr:hypothetical protein [Marinobacter halodurans]TBW57493.1 hypothetical protein EZI54_07480 [Marinobacter halodurans]